MLEAWGRGQLRVRRDGGGDVRPDGLRPERGWCDREMSECRGGYVVAWSAAHDHGVTDAQKVWVSEFEIDRF